MDYCLWEKEANPRNKIKISDIWESRTYFKALAFDNYSDIMIFLLWELPKKAGVRELRETKEAETF